MISVDEAVAAIRRSIAPVSAEEVRLQAAHGRALAAPVVAQTSQPPFAASAMDGYAVHFEDVQKAGARLDVVGISSAGKGFDGPAPRGGAVRIFTGAPVPGGADHVLLQELAKEESGRVVVITGQCSAQNIRPFGLDFRKSDVLIDEGKRLTPVDLALAAAGNVAAVAVRRRPRIALIANGDELVPPGGALRDDQIICSVPFGLAAMVEEWGGAAQFLGVAADEKEEIRRLAEQAMTFDLIVPVGGASVGDRDYMRAVFALLGFKAVFEKVSVKPGRPTWFARKGGAAALGLPGNPASALVTGRLFLKPAIERLMGLFEAENGAFFARTATPLGENGPREAYLRARLTEGEDGMRTVAPFKNQDSSLLSVMARANVLIRREAGAPALGVGELVKCLLI